MFCGEGLTRVRVVGRIACSLVAAIVLRACSAAWTRAVTIGCEGGSRGGAYPMLICRCAVWILGRTELVGSGDMARDRPKCCGVYGL